MPEPEKLFYTIGEVSDRLGGKPYVLRYWESEFKKLNPQKSVTGQRTYRNRDIRVAKAIQKLLYEEKYTIAGAIKKLEELEERGELDRLEEPLKDRLLPLPVLQHKPRSPRLPRPHPLKKYVNFGAFWNLLTPY